MKVKFVSQPFLINGSGFISIKNGSLYKIKKSIFRPNYARSEKMLKTKIVHLKKIYKFGFDNSLERRTVFILIKKTLLKIKSWHTKKMLRNKIFRFKKIYKSYFENFLTKCTVFVIIVINTIKNQKLNFLAKLYGVWKNFKNKSCTNFILNIFW